jgi:hypothetical protein
MSGSYFFSGRVQPINIYVGGGSSAEVSLTKKAGERRPFCFGLWFWEDVLCEDRTKNYQLIYFKKCIQLIDNVVHEMACVYVWERRFDLTSSFDI